MRTAPARVLLRPAFLYGAALFATAECRDATVIEERTASFRVVGRVTGPAGDAIAGAAVTVTAYEAPDCTRNLSTGGPFTTDAHGRYSGGFGSWVGAFDGCVEARVAPPAGGGTAPAVARGPVVHLEYTRGDSAVVDVQTSARP